VLATPVGTRLRADRLLRPLLLAVPVLFAVPILLGFAHSIIDLLGQRNPYFADISGTTADARALSFGVPLYQDPAAGYTPLIYTPLLTVLAAGLDKVYLWDGWVEALIIGADLALIAVAARPAWPSAEEPPAERLAGIVGAIGVGAFAFWLMAFVPFNFALIPRPDQLAWCFALIGLILVPAANRGSRTAALGSVLLLSAGFWTKQTTAPAIATAVVWSVVAVWRGGTRPRQAALFVFALLGLNAIAFALAAALTDGWAWRLIVDVPSRRASVISTWHSIGSLFESVGAPAVYAGVAWGSVALLRERGTRWPTEITAVAGILALFVIVDAPAAVWFRQAQGAVHNMFLGIGWSCGLLFAAAWGVARRRLASLAIVAGLVLALFAVSESKIAKEHLRAQAHTHVPMKALRAWVGFEPPALLRYARYHLVYHPAYPGIGARRAADFYPGSDNVETLLWSGVQPKYLVDALLDRRFDLVYPFENDSLRGDADGYGRWEQNYFWKLNQVIRTKYRPATGPRRKLWRAGLVYVAIAPFYQFKVYERRPGPDPAPWMRRCFGPFRTAGVTWRIARGGGFWCRVAAGSATLRLVATPARMSELRDDHFTARPGAILMVRAKRAGEVRVSLGDWHAGRRLRSGDRARFVLPRGKTGALRVLASRTSGAEVRLLN
jgi:hypothetical protein